MKPTIRIRNATFILLQESEFAPSHDTCKEAGRRTKGLANAILWRLATPEVPLCLLVPNVPLPHLTSMFCSYCNMYFQWERELSYKSRRVPSLDGRRIPPPFTLHSTKYKVRAVYLQQSKAQRGVGEAVSMATRGCINVKSLHFCQSALFSKEKYLLPW